MGASDEWTDGSDSNWGFFSDSDSDDMYSLWFFTNPSAQSPPPHSPLRCKCVCVCSSPSFSSHFVVVFVVSGCVCG